MPPRVVSTRVLAPFDPWKSPLCTCRGKLSLNPYTGCPHACLYCYASSYIPRFSECRPKKGFHLERDAARVAPGSLVTLANSSDPYPPMEMDLLITRRCLLALKDAGLSALIVTKSDIVARDIDILSEMLSAVSITVTTLREDIAGRLEPGAPLPRNRLQAIRELACGGIPVSARVDPIIPGINDDDIEDVISAVVKAGAAHIISSTYKARPDSLRRLEAEFPEETQNLRHLLAMGDKMSGSRYLPEVIRKGILSRARDASLDAGATFSACREGLFPPEGTSCDGSHLIINRLLI